MIKNPLEKCLDILSNRIPRENSASYHQTLELKSLRSHYNSTVNPSQDSVVISTMSDSFYKENMAVSHRPRHQQPSCLASHIVSHRPKYRRNRINHIARILTMQTSYPTYPHALQTPAKQNRARRNTSKRSRRSQEASEAHECRENKLEGLAYMAAMTASHCRMEVQAAPRESAATACAPSWPSASPTACQSWSRLALWLLTISMPNVGFTIAAANTHSHTNKGRGWQCDRRRGAGSDRSFSWSGEGMEDGQEVAGEMKGRERSVQVSSARLEGLTWQALGVPWLSAF